jgi:hypothetical protein
VAVARGVENPEFVGNAAGSPNGGCRGGRTAADEEELPAIFSFVGHAFL